MHKFQRFPTDIIALLSRQPGLNVLEPLANKIQTDSIHSNKIYIEKQLNKTKTANLVSPSVLIRKCRSAI